MELKHYTLTTLLSGCYQDEDPKYQKSEFNNFDRVDVFDSDLWNNDERFSDDEISRNLIDKPFSLRDAINDARNPIAVPQTPTQTQAPNKIYTIGEHKLVKGSLLEYDWLNNLLGNRLDGQQQLSLDHEPLDNSPVFICMKPYMNDYISVFSKYEAAGKSYYAFHISDELLTDPIGWYKSCKHVFRPYVRPDTINLPNVTHIPLGPYRTYNSDYNLVERKLVWSFFGTQWKNREKLMEGLKDITPNKYTFYKSWLDSTNLTASEYTDVCLNSIFIPCPPGMNVETFRFYEALEHGCIPLYVYSEQNDLHYEFLKEHLPLVHIDTWNECKTRSITILVSHLLNHQDQIITYRNNLLDAWKSWKNELKIQISELFV
jgi:hypothetical protein